jgi:hypothetical protein
MDDVPRENFITWAALATATLLLLQIIICGISSWVLKSILQVRADMGKVKSRVSHIEGHLEVRDEGAFKRLQTES